jgi:hypothetical protein
MWPPAPSDSIAQTFERRSHQCRAAMPLINERMTRVQQDLGGLGPIPQRRQLAGNGIAARLTFLAPAGRSWICQGILVVPRPKIPGSSRARDALSAMPLTPSRRFNSAHTSSGRTPASTQSTIR